MKFIDLFCGIGGFHQAVKRAVPNAECVMACDINKDSRQVYADNYGIQPLEDIRKIVVSEIPAFDILCAGFPCQAFSNAGKKKGTSDSRGQLFQYIINIIRFHNPKFLFLENVSHLKNIDKGKIYKDILNELDTVGYSVVVTELSPHQLGVPQQRKRLVFSCVRKDISKGESLTIPIPSIDISFDKIFEKTPDPVYTIPSDILEVLSAWDEMIQVVEVGEKLSPTILCHEFYRDYTDSEYEALPAWKKDYITKNRRIYLKYKEQWDAWYAKHSALLQKREIYGKLEWQTGVKAEGDSIFNHFIQLRQSGIRVKRARYFPTLVAIVQVPIYGAQKRYITPRECARLQSFPEDFKIHAKDRVAYKQFGNAVNVDIIHHVIEATLYLIHKSC